MKRIFPLLLLCAVLAGCIPQAHQSPAPETPPAAVTAPAPTPTPEPTLTPAPEPAPTSEPISPEELEFSIVIGEALLVPGRQSGAFPWGTELEADSETYWNMDGFYGFTLACGEGLYLVGSHPEKHVETTENGFLTGIENQNTDYKTYRGAYIGMSLEDFLELYPEAEQMNTGRIGLVYSYTDEVHCGFDLLGFSFEDDLLVKFWYHNGMDGWNPSPPMGW